jgi:tetratricopeptide (TPR) repeat protein
LYLTIGDPRRADTELSEIINEVRSTRNEDELSFYERYRLAMTLDLLGTLRRDISLLTEALNLFQNLLKEEDLSPSGRANLLGLIGETHRHKAEWESAKESYDRALELKPSAIHKVFLCECLLQLHQADNAAKLLAQVNRDELEEAEEVDYAFVLAALAIESGERERLESAKSVLKSVRVQDPFFREQRDAYLLNVQEAVVSGASQTLTKRTRNLLANVARSATSYLILKPSFMGMGVDIGKMFEDLSKKSESHSSDYKSKNDSPGASAPNR